MLLVLFEPRRARHLAGWYWHAIPEAGEAGAEEEECKLQGICWRVIETTLAVFGRAGQCKQGVTRVVADADIPATARSYQHINPPRCLAAIIPLSTRSGAYPRNVRA